MKSILLGIAFVLISSHILAAGAEVVPPPDINQKEMKAFSSWKEKLEKVELSVGEKEINDNIFLNELIYSQSPYLLQHAFNPVNWKSWDSELLAKAKNTNKLIFLSIGYSTCHWCHVMEEESFADMDVARLLNKYFYSIKVDREELPHIDDYYSAALEHVKGSAGWPITVIITGDGLPVFIDSYMPKDKLVKLLTRVTTIWQQQPEFLLSSARNIDLLVNRRFNSADNHSDTQNILDSINQKLLAVLDPIDGGYIGQVKFPSEAMVLYILDQIRRSPHPELERALKLQLDKMASGGLFDHIEGGFHRYSTDSSWTVPHYEKMLYNQAQLILAYGSAYEFFRIPAYQEIVARTTDFLLSGFRQNNEGFISAVDADLNGEEGGYYLLSEIELGSLNFDSKLFSTYQLQGSGKKGILFPIPTVGNKSVITEEYRNKLASFRQSRGVPHVDNKVLTGWNALAIKSLIKAEQVLGREELGWIATTLANRLWAERYQPSTGLLSRTGFIHEKIEQSFLEDYAYFCDALITLYDYSGEQHWLNKAQVLKQQAIKLFMDSDGGFYNVSQRKGNLPLKKTQDTELLSASAVMLSVISRLDRRLGDNALKNKYSQLLDYSQSKLVREPLNHLYTAFSLNEHFSGSTTTKRYFAVGNGSVIFDCQQYSQKICLQLSITINLQDGWHINSHKPLQNYLIPTKLELPQGYEITYPSEKLVKLGFQEQPLSVYEGAFSIIIKRPISDQSKTYLSIPLQACSDRVCLLPESISFTM